ncbi:MAG: phosphoribosylanthranilate isomerase [Candidatus Omnitrophica bacterium]|nr:phosphoribosylanthranilate isomerase [Candidatus Omnitrophota bacterium]
MVKIKICGITNTDDALYAEGLGAHALGFIFAESPRSVTPQKARAIIRSLPPFISKVGVFVDPSYDTLKDVIAITGITAVQLHGEESDSFCARVRDICPVIKGFRIKVRADIEGIGGYKNIDAVLLDTYSERARGGTGMSFDWELAKKAKTYGIPLILAGGISCENISEAITSVRPYAIDVASSIEKAPGKKDPALLEKLFFRLRQSA